MNQKKIPYLLLALLLGILGYFFYRDTIALFPTFIHGWTQSDRYALALSFLDNGMNLFKPQTYNLMTVDGVTGVDLPWHEYIIACIMRISGNESPFIFRGYTLLFSILGYFYLYKLARLFDNSVVKSFVLVVFTFTLPVMAYYQAGFVPSAPALSTTFIGLFFYFRFQKNDHLKDFYLAIGLITMAALLRSPYNIILFATLLQQALKAIQQKKISLKEALTYVVAYGFISGWHFYKSYLNTEYGSMFLTEIMPAESFSQLMDLIVEVKARWQWEYFTSGHYFIILLAIASVLFYLFRKKKCDHLRTVLSQQVILLLLGGICFFLLMTRQYPAHDYYMIDSLYPGVIMLVLLGLTLVPNTKNWQKWTSSIVLCGLIVLASARSIEVQKERNTFNFWDRGAITYQNFEGADVFLDSLGIARNAKMLVLDAYSTNAPLILMDRRGFTVQNTTKKNLLEGLEFPYDYVVIQDVFLPSDVLFNYPELSEHLDRLGGNGKISVYQYSKQKLNQNLWDNLGIPNTAEAYPLSFNDSLATLWEYDIETGFSAELNATIGVMKPENLFGPIFVVNKNPQKDKLLFSAKFKHSKPEVHFEVICTVMQGDQQLFYSSFPVHLEKVDIWQQFSCLFDVPDNLPDDIQLKCNVYNPQGAGAELDNVEVVLY